jgi:hypothetical protein
MSVMSEEVLPTFDISFEDYKKNRNVGCILNNIKNTRSPIKEVAHCFFNDFHDANLLGVKMLKLG